MIPDESIQDEGVVVSNISRVSSETGVAVKAHQATKKRRVLM